MTFDSLNGVSGCTEYSANKKTPMTWLYTIQGAGAVLLPQARGQGAQEPQSPPQVAELHCTALGSAALL